jgi:hypothetical protein
MLVCITCAFGTTDEASHNFLSAITSGPVEIIDHGNRRAVGSCDCRDVSIPCAQSTVGAAEEDARLARASFERYVWQTACILYAVSYVQLQGRNCGSCL